MADVFDLLTNRPEPTLAERKAVAANNVTEMTVAFAGGIVQQLNELYSHVWESPLKLTPQQVCDSLGTNAASIFKRHGAFVGFVATQIPQLLPLLRLPPSDAKITYETDADGNETGRVLITMPE